MQKLQLLGVEVTTEMDVASNEERENDDVSVTSDNRSVVSEFYPGSERSEDSDSDFHLSRLFSDQSSVAELNIPDLFSTLSTRINRASRLFESVYKFFCF